MPSRQFNDFRFAEEMNVWRGTRHSVIGGISLVEIRKVTGGDEKILAYIQTESWKAAFQDILLPETLDRCTDFSKAEAMYRKLLEEKERQWVYS